MLNLDRFDTDAERNIILVAEYFDLRGHLHAIAFSEGFDHAIRPTDCHLDRARVISQRECEGPTLPAQFLPTRLCELDDALKRNDLKVRRLRRRRKLLIDTCPLTSAVVMTSISTAQRLIHMEVPSHVHVLADKAEELQDHVYSCWPLLQFRHDLIPVLIGG